MRCGSGRVGHNGSAGADVAPALFLVLLAWSDNFFACSGERWDPGNHLSTPDWDSPGRQLEKRRARGIFRPSTVVVSLLLHGLA
jgi:hypothetical protein